MSESVFPESVFPVTVVTNQISADLYVCTLTFSDVGNLTWTLRSDMRLYAVSSLISVAADSATLGVRDTVSLVESYLYDHKYNLKGGSMVRNYPGIAIQRGTMMHFASNIGSMHLLLSKPLDELEQAQPVMKCGLFDRVFGRCPT